MIPEELLADLKTLHERGLLCEITEDGQRIFLIFRDYPLPLGVYNVPKTDLLIFTTPHYPNAGFDMFWVSPELRLQNGGVPKSADSIETYIGKTWRRFSYHPYNVRPWSPSEDSVISFVAYV